MTKVHFLHIGKTGGTALKHALKSAASEKFELCFHAHKTTLRDIPIGEKVVFFLRDPVSRFISGFYSRKRKGQPRYTSQWSKREEWVFSNFTTPGDIADRLASGDAEAEKAMCSVQHLKFYDKWYGSFEYFNSRLDDIIYIGFQESLDNDFNNIKTLLELDNELSLPQDSLNAHRNPKYIDKQISEPGRKALMKWYKDDYLFTL